jgi:membrane-bound lytic murein transglycosylase D
VRKGESLGLIAQRNRVSVRDLRGWNNLRSDRLRPGQKLVIRAGGDVASTTEPAPASDQAGTQGSGADAYIYHTVQPGDTLWGISQRYPGTSIEDLKRMNADMNLRKLAVGKKIKVGVQKS